MTGGTVLRDETGVTVKNGERMEGGHYVTRLKGGHYMIRLQEDVT
jgi:hypothetical protein